MMNRQEFVMNGGVMIIKCIFVLTNKANINSRDLLCEYPSATLIYSLRMTLEPSIYIPP